MLKSEVKMPSKIVGLSLCALLFMVGSLCVVAYVDDTTSIEVEHPVEIDEMKLFNSSYTVREGTDSATWVSVANQNRLLPSETGGSWMYDIGHSYTLFGIAIPKVYEQFDDNIRKSVITTSVKCNVVYWQVSADGLPTLKYHFKEVSAGVWECEFSDVEVLILQKYPTQYVYFGVASSPVSHVHDFTIDLYTDDVSLYVGEVVVGIVGVVMILVGIFISPLLSGEDIKKAVRTAKMKMSNLKRRR